MRFVLALVVLFLSGVEASADMYCFPPNTLLERLKDRGLSPILTGKVEEVYTLQVWMNPLNREWTIVVIRPDKYECFLTSGTDFGVHDGLSRGALFETLQ